MSERTFWGKPDRVYQGQGGAPGAAENVHFSSDAERGAQRVDVGDQIVGCVLLQPRAPVSDHAGPALAATALVKQDHAKSSRIKQARKRRGRSGAGPAMQQDHRLARLGAMFFPVDRVIWLDIDLQQTRCPRTCPGKGPFRILNLAGLAEEIVIHGAYAAFSDAGQRALPAPSVIIRIGFAPFIMPAHFVTPVVRSETIQAALGHFRRHESTDET